MKKEENNHEEAVGSRTTWQSQSTKHVIAVQYGETATVKLVIDQPVHFRSRGARSQGGGNAGSCQRTQKASAASECDSHLEVYHAVPFAVARCRFLNVYD